MMKNYIFAFSIVLGFSACSESETIDYYTGETGPAIVTTENAAVIANIAIGADLFMYDFLDPLRSEKLSIRSTDEAKSLLDGKQGGSVDGDCGGTVMLIVVNPIAESSIKFNDFCQVVGVDQIVINGSISTKFSSDFSSTITTIDMTTKEDTHIVSVAGNLSFEVDLEAGVKYMMNLSSHDSDGDVSIKLENYSFVGGTEPNSFSGRVYSSKISGYVDIETPATFASESPGGAFTSGKMTFTAGTAEITIEAVGDGDCNLSADIDGSGAVVVIETEGCDHYLPGLE